ncbi:response regulator [Kiritimatiellaeota bacterium B1221]|nr:response regulator [Kiritimatiellaeota bacterium B1221]
MKKTILIIDDEAPIRRLSKRLLERKQYQTLEAENGQAGLHLLEQHPEEIDAVLLDLHLPDGSGNEWAIRLRAVCPNIPIIYFTGSNTSSLKSQDDPHQYFLKKPFTPDSISDVVELAVS